MNKEQIYQKNIADYWRQEELEALAKAISTVGKSRIILIDEDTSVASHVCSFETHNGLILFRTRKSNKIKMLNA